MDFNIPADIKAYLDVLDKFIEDEIKPIENSDDNIRFFDHRREWARTDFENGGLPRHVMLDGSTRKLPFSAPVLPASQPARAAAQSQVVAKALAMGDMTMKLESAAL